MIEPIPFPALDSGPTPRLALQWFVFTLCVGAGWVLAVRKSAGERGDPATRPRRGPPPLLTGDEVVLTPTPDRVRRVGQLTKPSSSAMRRNCSTTSGVSWLGSR